MSRQKFIKRKPPRRRREGVTDYRVRLKLVKSSLPRLVIRKSNKYITVQIVESKRGGDKTLVTVTSKHLLKYGWKANTKNLPASYLTGFLAGFLAKKKRIEKAVVDIGLYSPISGSRLFAAVKGFIDAGIEVEVSSDKLPAEERIKGTHIQEYSQMIREKNIETIQFSRSPEDVYARLPEHFEEIKEKIAQRVGGV